MSSTLSVLALISAVVFPLLSTSVATPVYIGTGVDKDIEEALSEGDVLVLGGLFPVHKNEDNQCGAVLDLGIQRLEAMVFATQLINQDPSLLPGVTVAFEIRDTCIQANRALEQSLDYVSARELGSNGTVLGVSGVVGAASSGVSISIANLLRLFQIPQVSYASTAKILSDKTRFDYFFRTVPPDSLQAQAMAEIIGHFEWTYVFAIYSDDAYGAEGIQAFVSELEELNVNKTQVCIATLIEIPLGALNEDFDEAVLRMTDQWVSNASVAVLFGQLSTATGVLNAVSRRMQEDEEFAAKNFTWIGSDAWGDQLSAELHSIAQGMLSVIPVAKQSEAFDEYFLSLHPQNNSANPFFVDYWETLFNCSLGNTTSEYENSCDPSEQAITREGGYRQNSKVTFTIDAVYAFAHSIHNMQQELCPSRHGLCSAMLDSRSHDIKVNGQLLLDYLHNVTFSPGASADVIAFDESGDELGGFLIKNLQTSQNGRYTFKIVGKWNIFSDGSSDLDFTEAIEWSNQESTIPLSICSLPCGGGEFPEQAPNQADCCWTCKPCLGDRLVSTGLSCSECQQGFKPNHNKTTCLEIPPTFLTWSNPWSIVILFITSLGLIATSFIIAVFIVFNKHKLIKASSRELSAVLLTGILLCYLLPLFYLAPPSPAICTFRRFGIGICFAVSYSALLVKTNRIHRIFNRPSNTIQAPPLISPQSQLFFTSILAAVQVVIEVVWLVVEKPSIVYVYSDFSTELKCAESPHIQLAVSLGYNFILLILSTYFAFRTRKIPQNFNEAKFINLTLYTIIIIWLAFIPTYFSTARLGTVYQTSSLVLAIILSATTTLMCLFMPKIYFLFSQQRKEMFGSSTGSNARDRINSVCSAGNGVSVLLSSYSGDRRSSSVFNHGECL